MLKTAVKVAFEAKPRAINLLFQAFFVYSRVAYTIFPHTFSEKWHLRQDRKEGMCHFCMGYEEKKFCIFGFLRLRMRSYHKTNDFIGSKWPVFDSVLSVFVEKSRRNGEKSKFSQKFL